MTLFKKVTTVHMCKIHGDSKLFCQSLKYFQISKMNPVYEEIEKA